MNTLHRKISLGLTALAIAAACLGGNNAATARKVNEYEGQHIAKVNEYEGQHRLAKVNEYEGQHRVAGDPSQWG